MFDQRNWTRNVLHPLASSLMSPWRIDSLQGGSAQKQDLTYVLAFVLVRLRSGDYEAGETVTGGRGYAMLGQLSASIRGEAGRSHCPQLIYRL